LLLKQPFCKFDLLKHLNHPLDFISFLPMKNILQLLIFFIVITPIGLQSQNKTIKCTILDAATKQALEGASVFDLESKKSAITNSSGICNFEKTETLSIEISFVGYENQTKKINLSDIQKKNKDTIELSFYLVKISQNLNTITIEETLKEGILDKKQWLYDYELQGTNTWLLFNSKKSNRLIAINQYSDTIVDTKVASTITQIEHAMDNKLIISTTDSSYYIIQNNRSITIKERFNKTKYIQQIQPLVIHNNYSIYKQSNKLLASTKFRMVDLNTGKSFYLSNYRNADKSNYIISQTMGNTAQNEYLESIGKNYMGDLWISNDRDDLSQVRDLHKNEWNLEFNHLSDLPVYLKIVRDSLYIINHDNDSIYVFDNTGNFNRVMSIKYRTQAVHYPTIIVDEEEQQLYYNYTYKDACYLERIDLNTAKAVEKIKIKKAFPQKIRIRGGIIYFMQNKKGDVDSNNNLYLQALPK